MEELHHQVRFHLAHCFVSGMSYPICLHIMLQRFVFTWLMIGGFCLIIYGGPLALMITVFCVQVKVVSIICVFIVRSVQGLVSNFFNNCFLLFSASLRSSTLVMPSTKWIIFHGFDPCLGNLIPFTFLVKKCHQEIYIQVFSRHLKLFFLRRDLGRAVWGGHQLR